MTNDELERERARRAAVAQLIEMGHTLRVHVAQLVDQMQPADHAYLRQLLVEIGEVVMTAQAFARWRDAHAEHMAAIEARAANWSAWEVAPGDATHEMTRVDV